MSNEPAENAPITVVGIGASAGGLGALRELIGHLPEAPGMAFVVVVHLAPDHESHLADLLQPRSALPVLQVTDTMPLEVDHIYVIPPNRNLSAIDTHLRLTPLTTTAGRRRPIDHFFRTVAEVHDGHSIGVVLSGTGSDGTVGLAAIRAHGGLTIAQDPADAEYDGMPRSAILAETVDLVLPLEDIAERIIEFGSDAGLPSELRAPDPDDDVHAALRDVLTVVLARTGHDLSGYKESTILRRMQRRVQLHRMGSLRAYLDLLETSPDEVELLFSDLLIPVTNFFRDAEMFDVLQTEIVPALFADKGRGDSVRVWSAGCSTGEEAYSLAMLLLEYADTLDEPPQVQVFASDLHEASLQQARGGSYPATIERDVTPDRLARWFVAHDDRYVVRRELRDTVVFATHDLLADPPFSRTDLISCRNLLIYLQRDAQRAVTRAFHYALKPGGFLFLGASDTIDASALFGRLDDHRGIFRRRDPPAHEAPPTLSRPSQRRSATGPERPSPRPEAGIERLYRSLLERHGSPNVLVDGANRVVRFSSAVGRYLSHPGGAPTNDLFQLVDESLRIELRSAIHAAREADRTAVGRPIRLGDDDAHRAVVLRVVPVEEDDLLLVFFDEIDVDAVAAGASIADVADERLVGELDDANRRLELVIEQYEAGQDEMRAANEELQSTNEELRSTMEELETSKEELQSTNEELSTLNQENRHKVDELAMLSSDLQNLLAATDIATLFLDRQLRIVRFTPPVADVFNIVLDDRGRPLTDFTNRLQGHDLSADARDVLDRLVPVEHELRSDDGRWLWTRIIPYRTSDDRIEGVVVTFVDITRRYEAEAALRTSEHGLRLALDAAGMGTWWWDPERASSYGDDRAYEIVGAVADDGEFVDVVAACLNEDDRNRWWSFVRVGTDPDLEFRATTSRGDVVDIQVNVQDDAIGSAGAVSVRRRGTIRDVTSRVQAMEALADRTNRLTLLAEAAAHLLRGTQPETVLEELFDEMAGTLGLEIYEQFDRGDDDAPSAVGGNVTWAQAAPGEPAGSSIGLGACARAFEGFQPVVYNDVADLADEMRDAAERERVQAYGCFPLIAGGELFGALCFGTRGTARFDDATVELIRTIVDYLAVGKQRLRAETELRELNRTLESRIDEATRDLRASEEQLRRLAADLIRVEQDERQRIAQLLHDDLQQLLFGAQMRVGLLRDDIGEEADERAVAHLDEAERYLSESIDIARHLSGELAPATLDDDDLGETVRWLADQMRELHDLDVELNIGADLHVPSREIRVVVHQTVRELLFNVVKHAGVGHAHVDIAISDDELDVHVEDGGNGFDTDEIFSDPNRAGRGLATLRQRLSLVGGDLQLESIPGDGTSAHVVLPSTALVRDD